MQYLYLIECQAYHKIGIANDVQARLASLSTGNPFSLRVVQVYEFQNAEPAERAIHQAFAEKRERGEWFFLDDADLMRLRQLCPLLGGRPVNHYQEAITEGEIEEAEEIAEELSDWRVEVTANGKYWQWRERKRNGASKYGGPFETLPPERQEEYLRNRAKKGL